jgi:ferredoxin-NADP reductase
VLTREHSLMQHISLKIRSVYDEVKNFRVIIFEEGHGITYKPGQFLTFIFNGTAGEVRRSYSILSTPGVDEALAIGVKRLENGEISRKLVDEAKAGDTLITIGAGGIFTLPDEGPLPELYFFAAGSGITPLLSLMKEVLYHHKETSIFLAYSNHSIETTAFYNYILSLQREFGDRLRLMFLFSNHPDLRLARLNRDLLLNIIDPAISGTQHPLFYVCGPLNYMRLCTYTLQEVRVPSDRIRKETFFDFQTKNPPVHPPDLQTRKVFILSGNKKQEVEIHYPDTILQAANKQKIELPYSCKAGRCGSCAAICLEGKVWHSSNEVLTENDIQKGMILTCVAHPDGTDLVIRV